MQSTLVLVDGYLSARHALKYVISLIREEDMHAVSNTCHQYTTRFIAFR